LISRQLKYSVTSKFQNSKTWNALQEIEQHKCPNMPKFTGMFMLEYRMINLIGNLSAD